MAEEKEFKGFLEKIFVYMNNLKEYYDKNCYETDLEPILAWNIANLIKQDIINYEEYNDTMRKRIAKLYYLLKFVKKVLSTYGERCRSLLFMVVDILLLIEEYKYEEERR